MRDDNLQDTVKGENMDFLNLIILVLLYLYFLCKYAIICI